VTEESEANTVQAQIYVEAETLASSHIAKRRGRPPKQKTPD
jgi:hypothetical protein